MKVRYFYYETESSNKLHRSLWPCAITMAPVAKAFDKYLMAALATDFSENRYGHLELVLDAVDKVESGEFNEYEWEGQGFTSHITLDRVRLEHSVFGECPEWPIWCCTLAQYKAALLGYRRFLDMPKAIGSELIIDLPDGEPKVC